MRVIKEFHKRDLYTVPNLLTYFRLLLIPVFAALYLRGHFLGAALAVLASTLTDFLDGFLARSLHQVT